MIICAAVERKNFRILFIYFFCDGCMDAESFLIHFQRSAAFFPLQAAGGNQRSKCRVPPDSLSNLFYPLLLLPDDLSLPLAVPLHPTLPAGAGRRAKRSVSFHCGRGLPVL